MADDVHVDGSRAAGDGHPGARPGERGSKGVAAARAEDDLSGVVRPCEIEDRVGEVVTDDRVIAAGQSLIKTLSSLVGIRDPGNNPTRRSAPRIDRSRRESR